MTPSQCRIYRDESSVPSFHFHAVVEKYRHAGGDYDFRR